MTTVQESPNGHLPQKGYPQDALFAGNKVLPPPFSVENPAELNRADFPTNKANVNSDTMQSQIEDMPSPPAASAFPANAYHVPPSRFAPKAYPYRHDDTLKLPPETDPLPERCQFMFSDGRQCTMARSDIHPSLCHYHSEREEQLFGTPGPGGGAVVGRSFDLPELFSACRDLTTAAGVSRALAQVFRLLAQRRISRQEAATFGHLAQLLLRSISLMRSENIAAHRDAAEPVILSEQRRISQNGSHSVSIRSSAENDDATSIVMPSEYHERGASPALPPHDKAVSASDAQEALPPFPMDAADVPQTWVMRSPVAVEQRTSPPNSQASRNEHFRKPDSQALQNQQIQKLET